MIRVSSKQSSELKVYLNQSRVVFVGHHKCLGVIIDNRLCSELHIETIVRKIYGMLMRLPSVNLHLPNWVKTRLAHALLMLQIIYRLEVVSGTSDSLLIKIKRIVKRLIYNIRMPISENVVRFLGVSFDNYVNFRNSQIIITRICNMVFRRSYVFRVARTWNYLLSELRICSHTNNSRSSISNMIE